MTTMRFDRRMSDQDALMWAIEDDPVLRSTITNVILLDGPLDRERFTEVVERATRDIPRLRQRVVPAPMGVAAPEFVVDPRFELAYHLRFERVGGEGTVRDVLDFAAPLAMGGFDRARPLWELVVLDDLEGDRSAIVQKLHHSLIDGVGAVKMYTSLLDLSAEGSDRGPMPEVPAGDEPTLAARLVGGLTHDARRAARTAKGLPGLTAGAARDPLAAARDAVTAAGSVARMLRPVTEPLSPVMRGRSLSLHLDSFALPLDELRGAAKAVDGRLNDAFVAGIAGGLRRYHDHHGADVDQLRMTMPINLRPEDDEVVAGNRFVPARFAFPIDVSDPGERMRVLHELVVCQRDEPANAMVEGISVVLNRLPFGMATTVLGSMLKAIDLVASNVPGVPFPIYVAGAGVDSMIAFGPLGGAASNITMVSYLDRAEVGVSTDPAAVPDPEVYLRCLQAGFEEVTALGR